MRKAKNLQYGGVKKPVSLGLSPDAIAILDQISDVLAVSRSDALEQLLRKKDEASEALAKTLGK